MLESTDAPEESRQLYHPLQDSEESGPDVDEHLKWGFRLLLLLPGDRDSTTHCNLLISTLGKSFGTYEALSYVWGDVATTDTVDLDGQSVVVTQNLQCALQRLRYQTSTRLLWVDAFCIDQTSTEEKSTQVPRMWAIFAFARRALVFLGDEADDSDRALDLLHTISKLEKDDVDTVARMVDDPNLALSWKALLKLTRRPWWHRAWVIQEYTVATSVHFLCGTYILQGEDFTRAFYLLVEYRFKGIVPPKKAYMIRDVASTSLHYLYNTRNEYQRGFLSCKQVVGILYKFRGSKSLDPRDKIYSLHRLMGQTPELAPNYSQSVQDLYETVVKTAIQYSGTLEVLSHHNRNVQSDLLLLSWCPDWTIMRGKRILLWPNHYRACGLAEKPQALIKSGVLTLLGVPVARVQVLGTFPVKLFNNSKALYAALHSLQEKVRSLNHLASDQTNTLDAFRRTIVASRILNGPRGPATVLSEHQADKLWEAWSAQASSGTLGLDSIAKSYEVALFSALCGRALVVADNGSLGIVDEPVQDGDLICAFPGGLVLLCIRATDLKADRLLANGKLGSDSLRVMIC
jgi:hypothetical protein